MRRKYSCQLLNVNGVHKVRHTAVYSWATSIPVLYLSTCNGNLIVEQEKREKWPYNRAARKYLYVDLNKAYGFVGRQVLHDVLTEFGIPTIISLISMCWNGTYNKILIGNHSCHTLPIKNDPKQGDTLLSRLLSFSLDFAIWRFSHTKRGWNWMRHISFWFTLMMLIDLVKHAHYKGYTDV